RAAQPVRNAAARIHDQVSRALSGFMARQGVEAAGTGFITNAVDPTGVKAHGADIVQAGGVKGTGVKLGVLSDGVTSLASEQVAGRLPPGVIVLAGQGG